MAKLKLSVAVGDYDRTRALIGGAVAIDGVEPVFMTLVPEEIFFRAIRAAEFDICELSLSSYTMKTAQGNSPYIAVPAFLSRTFRHNAVYVRTDRVQKPADLKGRKVGVPEYQVTANVWVRAFLEDDYGVKPTDIHWIRGGIEESGRREKLALKLLAGVGLRDAPAGAAICPLVPGREVVQSVGAGEGIGGAEARRYGGAESHVALRRRDAQGRARRHGRGFLVIRSRAEPQGARLFPRSASRAGALVAAGQRGGAVSSGDLRDVQGVTVFTIPGVGARAG